MTQIDTSIIQATGQTMTHIEAQAFWTLPGRTGELRPEALPPLSDDEVRVRTLYSAISRGTEGLVFRGQVPESEYPRMRAPFQSGDFPGPVKYGYANVGVVEVGPEDLIGQSVFCLYPHQTRYQVPTHAVVPLPDDVPAEVAVLGANMETAVNGLWDAAPRIGDRIAIIGGGVVGSLLAWLCARIPGTRVQLVDTNPQRTDIASTLGARFATPEQATGDNDLVIHTSGSPAGLTTALALAGKESEVIEMSWFGDQPVSLPLGHAFHSQRLSIRSSQVGTVSPARAGRKGYRDRLTLAISLLNDPTLHHLINESSAFAELPVTLARLSEPSGNTLCHRVHYPTSAV